MQKVNRRGYIIVMHCRTGQRMLCPSFHPKKMEKSTNAPMGSHDRGGEKQRTIAIGRYKSGGRLLQVCQSSHPSLLPTTSPSSTMQGSLAFLLVRVKFRRAFCGRNSFGDILAFKLSVLAAATISTAAPSHQYATYASQYGRRHVCYHGYFTYSVGRKTGP